MVEKCYLPANLIHFFSGHDVAIQPDQSKPAIDLIDELLASATGKNNTLTPQDLSAFSTKRRREARASNSEFSLSTNHKLFGSSKYVKLTFTSSEIPI